MPNPYHSLAGSRIYQDVCRLDVLVDEAALMHLANRTHKWDRDVQEFHRVHGTADQSIERFAAGIPVLRDRSEGTI
jgi:hypothetical protein